MSRSNAWNAWLLDQRRQLLTISTIEVKNMSNAFLVTVTRTVPLSTICRNTFVSQQVVHDIELKALQSMLDMNTLGLTGKANLWSSPSRATTLDLTGGVSKHFGGPFDGQTNKQIGLGLNSRF
uniref:Attacin C-terminal domain-containing protein n=1 Tax=Glossina austeni TaxID=7395 RepID=A0A1A9VUF4_GLOAU